MQKENNAAFTSFSHREKCKLKAEDENRRLANRRTGAAALALSGGCSARGRL